MDPTPNRPRSDRRLAGGTPPPRPDVRVAVVDWSPCVRLAEHVASAIADNASTQVVDRQQSWEFLGGLVKTDFLAPTIKDLELTPVDAKLQVRTRDQLLQQLARRMAQGPGELAAAMQELETLRGVVLADLRRKWREVRQASDAQAAAFGRTADRLENVQLVCDIVTIWTPAGRVGRIVKSIASARENYEAVEKGAQAWRKVGGLNGIMAVASDERQRELVKRVLSDFVHEWAKDKLVGASTQWVGKQASRRVGRGMLGQTTEVFDGRSMVVEGWENDEVRKYSAGQVKAVMWKVRHGAESLGKLPGVKSAADPLYGHLQAATEAWYMKKAAAEQPAGGR